ncbi:MAG: hypothetical protein M0Z36_12785 [Thermaerobacter sp.]|nr:hypothetical protein [Thermaerobacter sp.]
MAKVVASQPYECPGTRYQSGTLFRRAGAVTRHEKPIAAAMIIYQDGVVEVACPVCGRYTIHEQ